MDSLRVFHNLKLDTLDEDWIRSIWEREFVVYDEPPHEYLEYLESEDARLQLHECCRVLKAWLVANERETPEFSWQALMTLDINVRGLLAVLGYVMKTGQKRVETDGDFRQACLEATSLYLMLLAIPGSNAFRVYHPNLYERAIETLQMSRRLFISVESSREVHAESSNVDNGFLNHCGLSHSEKSKLTREINKIISNLIVMLKWFRFKEHNESLDVTVRMLLDVTRLEVHVKSHHNYGITSLSQRAFEALQELCSSNHGPVANTIMLIVQYILPDLLFYHTNAQPKSIVVVHEAAIYFLKNLLKVHEQETVRGIMALIHQLMVKCPERLDGRQRQAAVVIKVLNICNKDVIVSFFKDLILFSHHGKISYRLFAQEIIGKLLTESSLSSDDLDNDVKRKMRKILIAIVSSRCMDRSAFVRGKAMATFALVSDCNDNVDRIILKGMFEASTADKTFPVIDELKGALSEEVDPLPGSSVLIAMLLDRINDERALVRRSALKISRNLAIMFPSLVGKIKHVISDRCRDPTLTVRQFAVHVLSEILLQFSHDSNLLDEWIQAVVPQIYDIEAKVQEKVLECLGNVLLNRITNAATYVPDAASSLPWRLLDRLSDMRMRKHLSKACSLWVKNSAITRSLISNLLSHVGTDNTIGAWILLAALVENMKIPNIDKYIADYKEIIQKNDFHASLILHVLRYAWPVLDHDCLEDLYQHLYKCISRFEINFNLISICLDILSRVLRYLKTENNFMESDMVKLMKLSEAKIQDFLEENDGCTQENTEKMRAMFTLGHASLFCTKRVSSSTLQIFGRLLLQWESLPDTVKKTKDLQASAVVLLCQQALRDREVAKEVTPILGNLMRQETSPSSSLVNTAVKVNAAKALADICVRFTALVEPYLPDLCISMKDPNPAVREAIVVIFIELLLEDFIKMKGPFFFHILTMLSDADNMIRELTIFLMEERLLMKNKTLISQQFLESIYHYNNCRSRSAFCGHRMRDQERKLLTLPGRVNQSKRNVIYEFMLEHLDVSARCGLVLKLTRQILREICDENSIDVTTDEGACVLRDAVFILSNNRLQPSSLGERHRDDPDLDETSPSTPSNTSNNNNNAIIATMKKHNLDCLLPTLITLKKKLVTLKSSLEDDVDGLLYKIYSEYDKDQLICVLNEYPELEKEMDRYQRKLRDKINFENDDNRSISLSPTACDRDSLAEICKRTTPRVLLQRVSTSTISRYKSNESIVSDNCLQIAPSYMLIESPLVHPERTLLIQTPPPEPSFSTSTPILTRDLRSCSNDTPTRRKRKTSSNERGLSPDPVRRKILTDNVS